MKILAFVITLFSLSSGFKTLSPPQLLCANGQYSYYVKSDFNQAIGYVDAYCRTWQMLPAAIPDAVQNQFLYNALSSGFYPSTPAAIGLKSENGNGTFSWLDGFTKYNYTNVRTDVAASGPQVYAIVLNDPNLGGKWTPYPPTTFISAAICERVTA